MSFKFWHSCVRQAMHLRSLWNILNRRAAALVQALRSLCSKTVSFSTRECGCSGSKMRWSERKMAAKLAYVCNCWTTISKFVVFWQIDLWGKCQEYVFSASERSKGEGKGKEKREFGSEALAETEKSQPGNRFIIVHVSNRKLWLKRKPAGMSVKRPFFSLCSTAFWTLWITQ